MILAWAVRNQTRLGAIVAASSWAAPLAALAQVGGNGILGGAGSDVGAPSQIPDQFSTVEKTIKNIFNIVIIVAGVAFVVLFLLGGIQYLTAAGNEESTKKARALMLDAVIGIAIVITAWAVGTYVLQLLGIGKGGSIDITPTTN